MLLPIPGKYGNRFSLSNTSKNLSKEFTLISLPNGTKDKMYHRQQEFSHFLNLLATVISFFSNYVSNILR